MSNASDQKVEDVLSSVRRLVSSELPRKPRAQPPEGPGALVLTDAHRIESDRAEKPGPRSLEDRIAELEAAVGGQGDEFEPDGSEDQAQHRPNRIVFTRPPATEEEASVRQSSLRLSQIALIETGPANDEGEGTAPATFRRTSEDAATRDEAPMAEDVPTEPARSADVARFTDPDDVVQKIEARIVSGRPISEPLQLVEPANTAADDTDDFDSALSDAVEASLAATDAEALTEDDDFASEDVLTDSEFDTVEYSPASDDPERTASEILAVEEDEPEAETPEDPSAGDDAPADAPATEASPDPSDEALAEADTAPEAAASEPAPEDAPDHDQAAAVLSALPDEDAMRLLIARLLREELAGDLGERITRNMRKLVRREIKRALSSKDLT